MHRAQGAAEPHGPFPQGLRGGAETGAGGGLKAGAALQTCLPEEVTLVQKHFMCWSQGRPGGLCLAAGSLVSQPLPQLRLQRMVSGGARHAARRGSDGTQRLSWGSPTSPPVPGGALYSTPPRCEAARQSEGPAAIRRGPGRAGDAVPLPVHGSGGHEIRESRSRGG